jgi:hypothetical protein
LCRLWGAAHSGPYGHRCGIERFLKICEDRSVQKLTLKYSINKEMSRKKSMMNLISLAQV